MTAAREVSVVDYHTEGEPMRIVTAGAGAIPGRTLVEKAEHLATAGRDLWGFLLREPRGHAAMCGAILTDPVTPGAHAGVLFVEPLGPVDMCGHGAMAVAAMLVETGAVPAAGASAAIDLDTPAGLVRCQVAVEHGRARSVTIRNVPSFSLALDLSVAVRGLGAVPVDLAYGGHFYALVPAAAVGLAIEPGAATRLVEAGERIRERVQAEIPLAHPGMPEARRSLYVQFYGPPGRPEARYRNAVVVAPAGLDRSPCGTGTSARMANLHARGWLRVGERFVHESIIGTVFSARIAEVTRVAGVAAVVPEITGRAWMMGRGTLVLDPRDPFPAGFVL
jgi:proline racemase